MINNEFWNQNLNIYQSINISLTVDRKNDRKFLTIESSRFIKFNKSKSIAKIKSRTDFSQYQSVEKPPKDILKKFELLIMPMFYCFRFGTGKTEFRFSF